MAAVVAVIGIAAAAAAFATQPERFAFSYLYGFITVFTLWLGSVFFVLIQHLTGAGWSVSVRRAAEFLVSGVVVLPFLFLPLLTQVSTLYPWWNADHSGTAEAQEAPASPTPTDHHDAHNPTAQPDDHGEPGDHGEPEEGHHAAAHGGHHAHQPGVIDHHAPHELLEEATLAGKGPFLNHGFFYLRAVVYFLIWLWIGLRLFGLSTDQDKTGDKQNTVKLAG
jgi:hypothetical protein